MEDQKKSTAKKSIVYIMRILEKYSDANHPLLQKEIANRLEKEYGVVLDRKAVGYNVKLLSEMFSNDDSAIRIVTKRKLGTYLAKRYMEDKDIQYLLDLVMSNYSITEEHRSSLYDKVRQLGSVTFREQNKVPTSFELMDPLDDDLGVINDEVDDGIVDIFRKAMQEKRTLSFNYSMHGETNNHYIGFLPIHVGIYNGGYYAYCYTAAKKYTWIRLSYVYDVKEEVSAIDIPTLGAFIAAKEHAGYPDRWVDYNYEEETFVLVVNPVLDRKRLIERFGTNITFSKNARAHLYTAKFRSTWENVRSFIGEYWESVVVAVPYSWRNEESNRKKLFEYAEKHITDDED